MNLTGIISISGKSGLYKVIAQAKNSVIVESLEDNKRVPAYATDRISALEDISIYTIQEDKPLKEVYRAIFDKENGGAAPSHKESEKVLRAYLEEILPDYDRERVYLSDIKKLFQWYNLLQKSGNLILAEKATEEAPVVEAAAEEVVEEKPKKKAPAKKAAAKPAAEKAEKKEKKEPAAKKAPAKKKKTEE